MRDDDDDKLGPARGLFNGLKYSLLLWLAIAVVVGLILSGCTTTGPVIGSCLPGQCIGPYDVTLTSHREALTNGL
jgi:hypothetical protein